MRRRRRRRRNRDTGPAASALRGTHGTGCVGSGGTETPCGDTGCGDTGWRQATEACVAMAGGGIKGGIVHGASDKFAAYPTSHPVTPGDLVATMYHQLGIDSQMMVNDLSGRPIHVAHGGRPILEILA